MRKLISAVCCALLSASMLITPLSVQGQDEDRNIDQGLVEYEKAKVDLAMVRPDWNWSKYKTIYIRPLVVTEEARDATPERRNVHRSLNESWIIPERDIEFLKSEFAKIFTRELQRKQAYKIVDEAGPDTLIIVPYLVDIYLTAPVEGTRRSDFGRGATYTEGGGALTITAIFGDGETGAIVGRIVDTRYPTSFWRENTRIQNMSDVTQIYRAWAGNMRKRLQKIQAGEVELP